MENNEAYLLRAVGIQKFFRYVEVLKGVEFNIGHNEIIGLIGDNGAGKSTLIKILTGVHKAERIVALDRGQIVGNFKTDEITLEEMEEKMLAIASTGHADDISVFSKRDLTQR